MSAATNEHGGYRPDPAQLTTTPALVDRMSIDFADHPAVIAPDRSFSYAQLRDEVRRAAAAMIGLGIEPGDRVAIWAPNTWHWVVASLAIHYAGGVLVPLSVRYTAEEAGDILDRTAARLLIAATGLPGADRFAGPDRGALPALRHVVHIPLDGPDSGPGSWDHFLSGPAASGADVDRRAAAVGPDDVADILFTSGTTGRSKGVVCAHRQSLTASAAGAAACGLTSTDRYLCINPFFHCFGYKAGMLAGLVSGATLVPQLRFDPELAMATIAEQRITFVTGPPTVFQTILDHPARAAYDLSSLRFAFTGSSTVPVALVERLQQDLEVDVVLTGYGLTEANSFGTACQYSDDAVTVATTCGRPIAGFELRIDSGDSPDGVGEVLLRGPNVMLGYLDDPAATAEAIDAEGWLHTGDVGVVDAAGNLRITDRLKDMYICSGFKVYPAEVEQVLARLSAVAQVAVVGVPHPVLGEVGRAFVVTQPATTLEPAAVITWARGHLADYKIPQSVAFVEELPRNASGKVLKSVLRERDGATGGPDAGQPREIAAPGLGGPPVGWVENWVADTWQLLLNITRPGRLDRFTDLGGSSLTAIEFSRMLATQFGVSMSLDRLAACPTIAELVANLQPGSGEQRAPVVALRTDRSGPVCLMVPGIGGHAWIYAPLAAAVDGPCDMVALSLMDLRHGPAGHLRARVRSAALTVARQAGADGRPFVVAGYSFGALIAADLACWLEDQGVTVAGLLLLDPHPLDSHRPPRNAALWQRVRRVATDPRALAGAIRRRWRDRRSTSVVVRSPAAQQLENDIVEMSRMTYDEYLDGSIRLPSAPVVWFQSREMATRWQSSTTLFATPIPMVQRTIVELGHVAVMLIPGVGQLAAWLDRQLAGIGRAD